jgi:hypothetical protein
MFEMRPRGGDAQCGALVAKIIERRCMMLWPSYATDGGIADRRERDAEGNFKRSERACARRAGRRREEERPDHALTVGQVRHSLGELVRFPSVRTLP